MTPGRTCHNRQEPGGDRGAQGPPQKWAGGAGRERARGPRPRWQPSGQHRVIGDRAAWPEQLPRWHRALRGSGRAWQIRKAPAGTRLAPTLRPEEARGRLAGPPVGGAAAGCVAGAAFRQAPGRVEEEGPEAAQRAAVSGPRHGPAAPARSRPSSAGPGPLPLLCFHNTERQGPQRPCSTEAQTEAQRAQGAGPGPEARGGRRQGSGRAGATARLQRTDGGGRRARCHRQ